MTLGHVTGFHGTSHVTSSEDTQLNLVGTGTQPLLWSHDCTNQVTYFCSHVTGFAWYQPRDNFRYHVTGFNMAQETKV